MIDFVRRSVVVGVLAAALLAVAGPPASSARPAVQARLVDGRVEISGSSGPDTVSVGLGPAGSDALEVFTGATRAPAFRFRRVEVTRGIGVTLGSGDDSFAVVETHGVFTDAVPTVVVGDDGADHLVGGSGGETLLGGPGPDLVEGRGGLDQVDLGADDDTVVWTADDGDAIIDGGSGSDHAVVRGAATGDLLNVSAVGGGVSVSPGSTTTAQLWACESLAVEPLTGSDKVVLGNLAGTGVTDVVVDLAPTVGGDGPDQLLDALVVKGTVGVDQINVSGSAGAVELSGLPAAVHLRHADPRFPRDDSDLLAVDTGAGDDVVTARGLSVDAIHFVVA